MLNDLDFLVCVGALKNDFLVAEDTHGENKSPRPLGGDMGHLKFFKGVHFHVIERRVMVCSDSLMISDFKPRVPPYVELNFLSILPSCLLWWNPFENWFFTLIFLELLRYTLLLSHGGTMGEGI